MSNIGNKQPGKRGYGGISIPAVLIGGLSRGGGFWIFETLHNLCRISSSNDWFSGKYILSNIVKLQRKKKKSAGHPHPINRRPAPNMKPTCSIMLS